MNFLNFIFLDDEVDLSDDVPSDEDDSDEEQEKTVSSDPLLEAKNWIWQSGPAPTASFDVSSATEGKPANLGRYSKDLRPVDYFFKVFPVDVFRIAVEETNNYAKQVLGLPRVSISGTFRQVDEGEVYRFISILLLMGVFRLRKKKDYWTAGKVSVVRFPSFTQIQTLKRFKQIKRFFHLADNLNMPNQGSPNYDKLYKVRRVYSILQQTFRDNWKPGTFLSLDESMTPWKGRSSLKQYMRSKPVRWGFKFFCVCDAATGYFLEYELFTGSQSLVEKYGLCTDVVLRLCRQAHLQNSQKILVADNYYSSPLLCAALAKVGIGYVGTCRLTRRFVPSDLISFPGRQVDIERGKSKCAWINLNTVDPQLPVTPLFMCSWKDTRIANFIGTAVGLESVELIRRNRKGKESKVPAPKMIQHYNERMGGVDRADQNKARFSVSAIVVTRKWWMRIFSGLLDMAIGNAWILYKHAMEGLERLDHQDFILTVAESLIDAGRAASSRASLPFSPNSDRHEIVPQNGSTDCVVCSQNGHRKRSSYTCNVCRVPLCFQTCFKQFHDLQLVVSKHVKRCELRDD